MVATTKKMKAYPNAKNERINTKILIIDSGNRIVVTVRIRFCILNVAKLDHIPVVTNLIGNENGVN
jgi:hypothetical protein